MYKKNIDEKIYDAEIVEDEIQLNKVP